MVTCAMTPPSWISVTLPSRRLRAESVMGRGYAPGREESSGALRCCSRDASRGKVEREGFDFAGVVVEGGDGDVGVVAEDDDPLVGDDFGEPGTLGFQRLQRVKIVGHDPGKRNVVARGEKIGDEGDGFAAAGEQYGLNVRVVAGDARDGNAGEDFLVAVDEMPQALLGDGREIFRKIAAAIAFGGLHGVFKFATLNDVLGAAEGGPKTIIDEARVASTVIEVEMGVDDEIDLIGGDPVLGESVDERVAVLNVVDGALFGVPFGAVAGFNEDVFVLSADEKRVGAHADAIFFVGRRFFLPKDFGNDAEHGAAVEREGAGVEIEDFEIAEVHGCAFRW